MLEHSVYSVISPEGCASILWRSGDQKEVAAEALKLTAGDLKELGIIDEIVPEPLGGAHRAKPEAIEKLGDSLAAALERFDNMDGAEVRKERREKFLQMGRNGLSS
jgi:acetyl-CoA carboxylase carboxyl transferase subunit alpha